VVQINSIDRATANASLAIDGIGVEILATDRASRDKFPKLMSGYATAWVERAFSIEARLVELRSVDPVKAEGLALHPDRIRVLDTRPCSRDLGQRTETKKARIDALPALSKRHPSYGACAKSVIPLRNSAKRGNHGPAAPLPVV
jgi:hypothetical protein